jgi:hypothetical protein
VKPIEKLVCKYHKKEPMDKEWIQLYCFTENTYMNHYGIERNSYNSYEKYLYPYITNFVEFVEHEHHIFAVHDQLELPYEYEFEQFAKPLETLFIAKYNSYYLIRTYSNNNREPKKPLHLEKMPELSSISFLFVEYYHPGMKDIVEINIPNGYYLEGNEILSPAFVHRMLEMMNIYYQFDLEYEIRFLDHTMTPQILRSDEYLEIKQDHYERKSVHTHQSVKEKDCECKKKDLEDIDMEIIENEDTETTSIIQDSSSENSDIEEVYLGYWTGWLPFW